VGAKLTINEGIAENEQHIHHRLPGSLGRPDNQEFLTFRIILKVHSPNNYTCKDLSTEKSIVNAFYQCIFARYPNTLISPLSLENLLHLSLLLLIIPYQVYPFLNIDYQA
jgi:hypothetical protein